MQHLDFDHLYNYPTGEERSDREIEEHLSLCPICRNRYKHIQELQISLLKGAENKTKSGVPEKSSDCPNENLVWKYVYSVLLNRGNFRLTQVEKELIGKHLEECDYCLNFVLSAYESATKAELPKSADLGEGKIAIAASDESELSRIRSRIGAEFIERGSIVFGEYSADIYFQDLYSAILVFKKNGRRTSELSGTVVEFLLLDRPMIKYSDKVEKDRVIIDFSQLDLSIEDYEKVVIRIPLEKSRVIIFLHSFSAIEE